MQITYLVGMKSW